MKYLNIALSVLSLLVAAAGTAMTGGLWDVSPQMIGLVMTGGALLGIFGVQPFPVTERLAKAFSAAALFLAAAQAYHAQAVTAANNPHPWVWAIIGCAAVLLGVIGRSPVKHDAAPKVGSILVILLAVAGISCYAHTPTPPCSEFPNNPACVPFPRAIDGGTDR